MKSAMQSFANSGAELKTMLEGRAQAEAVQADTMNAALFAMQNQIYQLTQTLMTQGSSTASSSTSASLPAAAPGPPPVAPSSDGVKRIAFKTLKFKSQIGGGAFGVVYRGEWNGTPVAIKRVLSHKATGSALDDLRKEIQIMSKLVHTNIVSFYGAVLDDEDPLCIVYEFMDMGSLYDLTHDRKNPISLGFDSCVKISLQIARGIAYLHSQGIVHRDLKSPNILINNNWNVKITDFGLSRSKQESEAMKTVVGSPAWMAPEILEHKPYDESVDVYSFGILMWELYSGQRPFKDMAPLQIAMAVISKDQRPPISDDMPPPLSKLISECWAKDPKDRPSLESIMQRLHDMDPHPHDPIATTFSSSSFAAWNKHASKMVGLADVNETPESTKMKERRRRSSSGSSGKRSSSKSKSKKTPDPPNPPKGSAPPGAPTPPGSSGGSIKLKVEARRLSPHEVQIEYPAQIPPAVVTAYSQAFLASNGMTSTETTPQMFTVKKPIEKSAKPWLAYLDNMNADNNRILSFSYSPLPETDSRAKEQADYWNAIIESLHIGVAEVTKAVMQAILSGEPVSKIQIRI